MTRLENAFSKKALITYIMGGDGGYDKTLQAMHKLADNGSDIIELGMAFSDPMAEGVPIQKAALRALEAGATLKKTIDIVREFRKTNQHTSIILMGYYNPILAYGLDNFAQDTAQAGVDGYIIVDLPIEEEQEFVKYSKLPLIHLIAPTTTDARLKTVAKAASGFVYYISIKGVTGTKSADNSSIELAVTNIRKFIDIPVVVGFGITNSEQAAKISQLCDGVVIGSAIVNLMSMPDEDSPLDSVGYFVSGVKNAL